MEWQYLRYKLILEIITDRGSRHAVQLFNKHSPSTLLGSGEIKSYLYLIKRRTVIGLRNNVIRTKKVGDRWYIGYIKLSFLNKTAKL